MTTREPTVPGGAGARESFPLPDGATEGFMRVNGVRLHYVSAGDSGPLVILLHGFPEFWYSWRHQIPALAQRFRVVAPDMRGYNLSEKPGRGYAIGTLCDDIAGVAAACGEREAAIVGHDWGGVVAWALAMRAPRLVAKLAIVNAPHPGPLQRELRHWRQLRRSWYVAFFQLPWLPEWTLARHDYAVIRDICDGVNRASQRQGRDVVFSQEDVARFVAAMARPGARTATINYYRALVRGGPRAFGSDWTVQAPTRVLWGERDPALGVELLDRLDAWVPRLEITRFPDAGHWVNQERPREVNAALLDFLG